MKIPVLVIGGINDPDTQWVAQHLSRKVKIMVVWLGGEEVPIINYDYQTDTLTIDGIDVEPQAVWCRRDVFSAENAYEWHHMFQGWLQSHPHVKVINRDWLNRLNNKVHQLYLAKKIGFMIPETVITNNFHDKNDQTVIKPLTNGYCQNLSDFNNKRRNSHNDKVRNTELMFCQSKQRYPEIRIFGACGNLYAFEIHSKELDYRTDTKPLIKPFSFLELDTSLIEKCLLLFEELHLQFGAIDLKMDPRVKTQSLLEVNDFPMFSGFDHLIGGGIVFSLSQFLVEDFSVSDPTPCLEDDDGDDFC